MGDSGALSLESAAERIGVSTASLAAWARTGIMRHERDGRSYLFAPADCDLVKDLREAHGKRKWVEHAPWDTSGKSEETEESTEPPSPTLAQRLIAKAKAAKEKGEYLMAYEMLETVVDSFDWSEA